MVVAKPSLSRESFLALVGVRALPFGRETAGVALRNEQVIG